ncbi:MAG: response regulator [Coriobacteriales bacterium]|jgi:signal transduction histidine kinase|nr:response regulator [Coriobacteriales bacterium]MDR0350491.1 response regulator [Coriobacteriales bacterium]
MKQQLQALLDRHILSDELSIDARRINIMLVLGFLVAFGCTVMRVLEGSPSIALIIQIIFLLTVIIAAFVVNIYKLYTFAIYAFIIFLDFILLPLAFFVNGGLATGMPSFFAMGIAIIALLTVGRRCFVLILVNAVWVISCYLVASRFPQLVLMPSSPLLSYIDHIGSFIMVSFFIAAVIRLQNFLYAREHDKVERAAELQKRHNHLRTAVNILATELLNSETDDFDCVFQQNIGVLAENSDIDRITLWRNGDYDGEFCFLNVAQWVGSEEFGYTVPAIPYAEAPGWFDLFVRGGVINGTAEEMDEGTRNMLAPYGVQAVLAVPVFYQNKFEGFVSFDNCRSMRRFDEDESDILRSASLILLNALVRQEITDSLVEAREDALAGNRAKSEFLSNMSHEIRTPMSAIIGMIAIAKGTDDVTRKNDCLDKMEEASSHLLGIINDVLDMSKIEANKLEICREDFFFSRLIERVLNVSAFQVKQKNLNFTLDLDPNIPEALFGDDQRISQVIANLLSNAIKFTPESGAVTLSSRLLDTPEPRQHHLEIAISDTGIGMDDEQLSRLFQPFQQAESSTARRFGGTGLGLVISKRIVDLMGGSVTVESKPGEGTSFRVILPIEEARGDVEAVRKPEPAPEDAEEVSFVGRRILLAEDVEVNREIVMALMEPTGVEIDCASNGLEAVELFSQEPERYDLILMDVQMPELDGCDATRRIRALSSTWARKVPIIALTANVFKEDIEHCLAAGMNGHLGKPFDQAKVFESIQEHLK